ncbi:MAG: hypothetical protein AB1710_03140 [Pseudomonadota bacterium]
MKFSAADLRALRRPLLALAAVALLGGAGALHTGRELRDARERLAKQQSELLEARQRLQKAGEEKAVILRYLPDFLRLQQQGFIGAEQRINWLEALRAANLRVKLFGVDYRIEAQQPSPLPVDTGSYRLRQSPARISLGLLHEEDLMRFIDELSAQQAGIFALRECVMQRRAAAKAGSDRLQPHLQAECSLAWLTIANDEAADRLPASPREGKP